MEIKVLPKEFRKQHITIDVEEWFHILGVKIPDVSEWDNLEPTVEKNTHTILEILEKTNNKATFFFLGWVAKRYPNLVKEVNSAGHEIASHGFYHKDSRKQSNEKFLRDITDTKFLLEDITSDRVYGYRSPAFSSGTNNSIKQVSEAGYYYDASIFPAPRDTGGNTRVPNVPFVIKWDDQKEIIEFPVSISKFGIFRFPIGGGYLRVYPKKIMLWLLQKSKLINEGYLMLYIHPREIDGGNHPKLAFTKPIKRLKTYYGLKSFYKKAQEISEKIHSETIINTIKAYSKKEFQLNA